jgi:hypothetical protein
VSSRNLLKLILRHRTVSLLFMAKFVLIVLDNQMMRER